MSVIDVKHRRRGRAADNGGMYAAGNAALLRAPEAQPAIRRIGESICRFSTVDPVDHARRIAAVAVAAKREPMNPYARATL